METIAKQVKASYPGGSISPLIEVSYYESDEMYIITNEKNELLEISQCNIPALIAMLQSINNGIQ